MDSRVIRIAERPFPARSASTSPKSTGTFDGELTARSQLIIHATGKVSGKIATASC